MKVVTRKKGEEIISKWLGKLAPDKKMHPNRPAASTGITIRKANNVNNVNERDVDNVNTIPSQRTKPLSIWCTKADSLHDKLSKIKNSILSATHWPDIIAITEAKAKNARLQQTMAEFNMDGYDIFTHNLENTIDWGIVMYADNRIQTYEL